MKKKTVIKMSAFAVFLSIAILPFGLIVQNPIVQTNYITDPPLMGYNDPLFLYACHDEDDASGFKMQNWLLYSFADMVNRTEHGVVASLKNFKWITQNNWVRATQCICTMENSIFITQCQS